MKKKYWVGAPSYRESDNVARIEVFCTERRCQGSGEDGHDDHADDDPQEAEHSRGNRRRRLVAIATYR